MQRIPINISLSTANTHVPQPPEYVCALLAVIPRDAWSTACEGKPAGSASAEVNLPIETNDTCRSFRVVFADETEETIHGELKLSVKTSGTQHPSEYSSRIHIKIPQAVLSLQVACSGVNSSATHSRQTQRHCVQLFARGKDHGILPSQSPYPPNPSLDAYLRFVGGHRGPLSISRFLHRQSFHSWT